MAKLKRKPLTPKQSAGKFVADEDDLLVVADDGEEVPLTEFDKQQPDTK